MEAPALCLTIFLPPCNLSLLTVSLFPLITVDCSLSSPSLIGWPTYIPLSFGVSHHQWSSPHSLGLVYSWLRAVSQKFSIRSHPLVPPPSSTELKPTSPLISLRPLVCWLLLCLGHQFLPVLICLLIELRIHGPGFKSLLAKNPTFADHFVILLAPELLSSVGENHTTGKIGTCPHKFRCCSSPGQQSDVSFWLAAVLVLHGDRVISQLTLF